MQQEAEPLDAMHGSALLRSNRSLQRGLGAVLLILLLLVTLPPTTTAWIASLREQPSSLIQEFEDLQLQVENDVQSLQAAQRGYVITQQPLFLESYQSTAARVPSDLERLLSLAHQIDPPLVAMVEELAQHIQRWQREGPDEQLRLIQQDDLAAAVAGISSGKSQQRFDAIIEQITLLKSELGRIDAALAARVKSVRRIETILMVGLGLLGLALGGYLVRMFQGMARLASTIEREQQRAEQAMRAAEAARGDAQVQLDASRRRNRQLRVLNRVASMTGGSFDIASQAGQLLDELVAALEVSGAALWRRDPQGEELSLLHARRSDAVTAANGAALMLPAPRLLHTIIGGDRSYLIEDVAAAELEPDLRVVLAQLGGHAGSVVIIPLQGRSRPIGALLLAAAARDHFRSGDAEYYAALAGQAGLVLENAELNETIRREQQRLQIIFDQSPEGILFADSESGTIVLANDTARALLGAEIQQGQPLSNAIVDRFLQASGEPFPLDASPLVAAFHGKASMGSEVLIDHPDGRRIPVLFNCVPLSDPAGEVRGAVAVFQDLSRLREVDRLKADFVAMVSHELRTPLTAIEGCAQSLLHPTTVTDMQRTREFLEIIVAQSERLHELIDNLLDMSQVEAGVLRLRMGPVEPARLIRSVVREVAERLPDRIVQADIMQPLPMISADADRIEQVLLNLLDNARKFSPAGSIITLAATPQDDVVLFSVRDQGPGIPPAERTRIFDRFFQGMPPAADIERGTGLGLAICKALVEAHGGQIWVDETVSDGARICFSLPRTPLEAERVSGQMPLNSQIRTAYDTAHILVVDDEVSLRQMLAGSLRNAGYVVRAVAEGQAALEVLATESPDVVVLDLFLPGQDGFAVLQQIRDWSDVLVMILTASSEPDNVVRGLQLGADDYLTKPFRMDEFLARIAALLRRRGAEVEAGVPVIQRGPLQIDVARRQVLVDGATVVLTPTEFRLLTYLAQHAGQVLTHAQILQQVWGPAYGGESQYLWVHIGRLRQKIEADPRAPRLILTERGVGYQLAAEMAHQREEA